jgi:enamine deaminase RidA (YjgF/YER057c/UK114 family)
VISMWRFAASSLAVLGLVSFSLFQPSELYAQKRNKKNEEPKSQVLPLPPELPMVLAADTQSLDFHISPLLKSGGLAVQIRRSLNDLLRDTKGETIVKLRAFVSGVGDARRVQTEVASIFSERKLPLPVLTILQVGRLGDDLAQVVIEAVVSTKRTLNPNGLGFLSGQTGKSLREALDHLRESATEAEIGVDQVVSCTCFAASVESGDASRGAVEAVFPKTAVNVVQALRDPVNSTTMCQAIAQLSHPAKESALVWVKNAHVSLVNSPRLVFTGLQLSFGNYLDDAREAFTRLQRLASALKASEAPVQVNAFSLDLTAASALRKSTSFPPSVFTVQTVEGLPSVDASAGMEAILAPDISQPSIFQR